MSSNAEEKNCWLCLSAAPLLVRPCGSTSSQSSGGNYQLQQVSLPCKCPTLYSHGVCLARWQVRNAGLLEEHSCRFCLSKLPKWSDALKNTEKPILTSPLNDDVPIGAIDPHQKIPPVPMMTVKCKGKVARIPCVPGEEGQALFLSMARSIFNISSTTPVDARFAFKESSLCNGRSADTNESIVPPDAVVALHGLKAFDTACQLASVLSNRDRRHEKRNGGDPSSNHSLPDVKPQGSRNTSVGDSALLQRSRGADSRDLSLLVSGMEADVNHEGGTPRQGLSGSDIRPALDGDLIRGTTGQAQGLTQTSQIDPAQIHGEDSAPHWSILKPGSWAIFGCFNSVGQRNHRIID